MYTMSTQFSLGGGGLTIAYTVSTQSMCRALTQSFSRVPQSVANLFRKTKVVGNIFYDSIKTPTCSGLQSNSLQNNP